MTSVPEAGSKGRLRPADVGRRHRSAGIGKCPLAALCGLLVAPFPHLAAEAATDTPSVRFDGRYYGLSRVTLPLSSGGCLGDVHHSVVIADGKISGGSKIAGTRIEGAVSEEGHFSATYTFADGIASSFEGTIEGGAMIGGVVKDDVGCFWTLRLVRD